MKHGAAIIVIGTGLAGYHLAKELRKLDTEVPLILITQDDGAFYSKPMLSNAVAKQKTPAQLVMQTADVMAQQLNAQILTQTTVLSIDAVAQQVVTRGGVYAYRQLVLACGAQPVMPPISGAERLFNVNNLTDYGHFRAALEQLKNALDRPPRLLILGAGLIGCEFANDFVVSGFEVQLVDMATQCLPRLLPAAMAAVLQARLVEQGVRFHFNQRVQFIDDQLGSYQVSCESGQSFSADLVLSAIGLQPNIALAQQAQITTQRGIVVDAYLRTSVSNIYALGDCAQVQGHWLCYVLPLMAAARALAKTLSGQPTSVRYPSMPVVIKTPACPLVVCPPPPFSVGQWQVQSFDDYWQGLFTDAQGSLCGFALLGNFPQVEKNRLLQQMPILI